MALSANATRESRGYGQFAVQIKNADEVYAGAYLGALFTSGRAEIYNDAANIIPLGFATTRETGNTSASPIPTAKIFGEGGIFKVAVTGLAGTVADNFALVFATDDGTFTLTRPAVGGPIGVVSRFIDATDAYVHFFSFAELCILALAGNGRATLLLGVATAGAATGNVATGVVAPFHGVIDTVYGVVIVEPTDADVVQTINLEIGGTNVTGGVVTFQHDSAVGAKLAGTAVTAANRFHQGDLIDIETVATTAGTTSDPGLVAIYADVTMRLGY